MGILLGCDLEWPVKAVIWLLAGRVMDLLVVVFDVVLNSLKEFKTIIARVQVDVVVLEAFPEALDPGVIGGAPFSVHRYLDSPADQELSP